MKSLFQKDFFGGGRIDETPHLSKAFDMPSPSERDLKFIELAFEQARMALASGNLPIGAVIVHNDQVISRGHNLVDSECSDLNHAEILAIRKIERYLFKHKGACEIFTTVEPCLMCMGAIYNFKFSRIVFGCKDLNAGFSTRRADLPPSFVRRNAEVIGPVWPKESVALIRDYCERTGRRTHLLDAWT